MSQQRARLFAIRDMAHGIAHAAEARDNGIREVNRVLDDQQPHGSSLS